MTSGSTSSHSSFASYVFGLPVVLVFAVWSWNVAGFHLHHACERLELSPRGAGACNPGRPACRTVAHSRTDGRRAHPATGVRRVSTSTNLRFWCPHCAYQLSAPVECAGRTSRCRGCGNPVTVPAADDEPLTGLVLDDDIPEAVLVPVVFPVENENDEPLTACTACEHRIAKKAATCPSCGAPNEWVHGQIVRFFRSAEQFRFAQSIRLSAEKFVLTGVDDKAGSGERALANLANSFSVRVPFSAHGLVTMIGVQGGQAWANEWAKKKVKAFRVDFSTSPPGWSSTDDSYWFDVMEFFGLRRPKKRRRSAE